MRMPAVGVRWHFISGSEEVHKSVKARIEMMEHPRKSAKDFDEMAVTLSTKIRQHKAEKLSACTAEM